MRLFSRLLALTAPFLAGIAGIAGFVGAQQAAPKLGDPLPTDPAIVQGRLANGLRYFVRRNEKPQHRAELRLVVRAGSILEDDDQRGLAHFVEHMQFEGTAHFPGQGINNFLGGVGRFTCPRRPDAGRSRGARRRACQRSALLRTAEREAGAPGRIAAGRQGGLSP